MTAPAFIQQENFRRILTRNISLPLGVGALSAAVFVGLIFYLLSALGGVEHTERAISKANQIGKLGADMETSMYGYLVTGEESLLQPFEIGKPRIAAETASLAALVGDNQPQISRLRRIGALQSQWNEFAQTIVDLRRKDRDYQEPVRSAGGRSLTNEIRREFAEFIGIEERLLQQRNEQARSTTFWGMAAYLLYLTIPVSEMFRDPGFFWPCASRSCPICAPMPPSRSGLPAAAPARRSIRWPSCSGKKACWSAR